MTPVRQNLSLIAVYGVIRYPAIWGCSSTRWGGYFAPDFCDKGALTQGPLDIPFTPVFWVTNAYR